MPTVDIREPEYTTLRAAIKEPKPLESIANSDAPEHDLPKTSIETSACAICLDDGEEPAQTASNTKGANSTYPKLLKNRAGST